MEAGRTGTLGGVWAALALGVCLIIAAWIAANAFYKVHTLDNTLSVTGSASQEVDADSARWTVTVSHTSSEAGIAASEVRTVSDAHRVIDFFQQNGIASSSISTSPVGADQNYNSNGAPTTYNVHQDITVQSDDPSLIESLSRSISSLANEGLIVSSMPPEYYVSGLPKLRIALVGAAVTDAKARALQIASSTGQTVGDLESASGGVVQVLQPNSTDVSGDGSYDTSTIHKVVTVTAHATFYLR